MKRFSLVLISAALVGGCASSPEPQPEPEFTPIESKEQRVTRDLTLSWDNIGRGGAALRQPAYIHVLGQGTLQTSGNDATIPAPEKDAVNPNELAGVLDDIDSAASKETEDTGKAGFSLYELSRWERFCDQGEGMDEPDWKFVTKHGAHEGIPSILSDSCDPPSHSYDDYLNAWTNFCTSSGVTSAQRDIVRNSVRPQSRVNPCAALSLNQ